MIWLYYTLLAIVLVVGLLLNIFSLPGLWLMAAGTLIYAWLTDFNIIGLWGIVSILILCIIAEIVEFVFGGLGAKKAGASQRAVLGAIIGGVLGGFFLTFLVPVPVLGTIVGVCAGSFLGAAILEFSHKGEVNQSMRVGVGAAKGRFLGIMSKLVFGVIILLIGLILAFPLWQKPAVPPGVPPPATLPITSPTTQANP